MSDKNKYNIIWLQTDEHRCDSIGCYGSEWAITPNLDRLAARGVLFRNAYCQSPICSPSRASQLTARYPQEINALSNLGAELEGVFPEHTITFPEVFASIGYETVNLGKSHTPAHQTWQQSSGPVIDPEVATYANLHERFNEDDYDIIKRPGGPGIIIGGTYPEPDNNPCRILTDQAIDFLKNRDDSNPLLLRVSYNWPHTPVLPPPPYDKIYDDTAIPVVYCNEKVFNERSCRDREIGEREKMWELDTSQQQKVWRDYMALAAYVDSEIGRLLDYLDNSSLRENTIILFSSDHGRNLGEWGAGEKCTFDDCSFRVPFIWSCPGLLPEGEERNDVCELLDTAKTLLSLADCQKHIPVDFRGRNLFDITSEVDTFAIGQIGWPSLPYSIVPQEIIGRYARCQEGIPRYNLGTRLAIRYDRYKMDVEWIDDDQRVPFSELDGNLFDLQTDPAERHNLFSNPEYADVVKKLLILLDNKFSKLDFPLYQPK